MSVVEYNPHHDKPVFSFEILPPLKGNSVFKVFRIIDKLKDFNPSYINITSHHSEYVLREQPDGSLRRISTRKRPGTVAIAAAIQNRYGIAAVPHIICKGFSKEETEYALLDLNFLGISNLLLLRGDCKSLETMQQNPELYHEHAVDLQEQVNLFNQGFSLDGTRLEGIDTPFSYGMACYPEKHEEAPNFDSDLYWAKKKVEGGASYLVTQMFFDNQKYFRFVERCREAGITVPIIPGIKPIVFKNQINVLPRVFRSDIPEEFAAEIRKCRNDEEVCQAGVEWAVAQCRELMEYGVDGLHFYTFMATDS
ncbi:MAG: methylenetetrahydrofolate reductase, partial [Muribaculaceae bacterium]|nr:methylenetetrahydrofolate reductase [Muribaculaceae bacterium]